MRHKVKGYRLNRSGGHRTAMRKTMIRQLFEHERITTTLPKAKSIQPLAEKLINGCREIVQKLFDDIGPRYTSRNGGYTRILKLGPRRSDGAEMALIELVEE